jgi:hypothetical protein
MRCNEEVLERAKTYAKAHHVPLSQLVNEYFLTLGAAHDNEPKTDEELGVEQA